MIEFLQTTWPTLALLAGMAILFFLRNRPSPVSALEGLADDGTPAVVEIFSNM